MPGCPRRTGSGRCPSQPRATISSACTEDTCANSAACARRNSEFCPHGLATDDGECRGGSWHRANSDQQSPARGGSCSAHQNQPKVRCQPAELIASDSFSSLCSSSCPVKTLSHATYVSDKPQPSYSLCGPDCGAVEAKNTNTTANSNKAFEENRGTNDGMTSEYSSQNQGLPQRAPQSAESNGYKSDGMTRSGPQMTQAQGLPQQGQGACEDKYGTNRGGMASEHSSQNQGLPQRAPQSAESNCCMSGGVRLTSPHMSQAQGLPQQGQGACEDKYGTNRGGMASEYSSQYQGLPQRVPQYAESNGYKSDGMMRSGPQMSQAQGPAQQGQGACEENCRTNRGGMPSGYSSQCQGLPQRVPQSAESNCCMSGAHTSQGVSEGQGPSVSRRPSLIRIQDKNQKQNPLGQQTTRISSCCQKNRRVEQGGAGSRPARCACVPPPAGCVGCTGNLAGNCTCSDRNK